LALRYTHPRTGHKTWQEQTSYVLHAAITTNKSHKGLVLLNSFSVD
jgi:hypothetical protein